MLEAGRYRARGVEAGLGYTNGGSEQIAVLLEVQVPEGAPERITWYGYFTEKTTERTLESLRHLGWSTDDLSDLTGIDANEVEVIVEHEDDLDGNPRARVKWINSGHSGGLALKSAMPQNAAKALAAKLRGAAVASRQRASGAMPAAPAARPAQSQARSSSGASHVPEPPPGRFDDEEMPF